MLKEYSSALQRLEVTAAAKRVPGTTSMRDEKKIAGLKAELKEARNRHGKSITKLYNLEQRLDNFKFGSGKVPPQLREEIRKAKKENQDAYQRVVTLQKRFKKADAWEK